MSFADMLGQDCPKKPEPKTKTKPKKKKAKSHPVAKAKKQAVPTDQREVEAIRSREKYQLHRSEQESTGSEEYALPLGYLSPTQIEMDLRCPKQYEYRYIDCLKMPPAIALVEGSAHHIALSQNNKCKVKTYIDLPPQTLFDQFVAAFDTGCEDVEDWEGQTKDDILKRAEHMLQQYLVVFAPNVQPISENHIEHPFAVDIAGIEVQGYIDVCMQPSDRRERAAIAPDADVTIIDYKTSSRAKSQQEVLTSLQLGCYGTYIHNSFAKCSAPRNATTAKVDVGFCVLKKSLSANSISYVGARITQERMNQVERVVTDVAKSITLGFFPRCSPSNYLCNPKYCGYYRKCYG